MPTFYDIRNQPHVLTERVGSGGEGTVYACEDSSIVAKIYHEPITEEKAEKLRWMAANKNEQLLKVAAWVIDILTDAPDGKIVGFLMPNVKAKEIHELYSLKSRRVYFPEATWHFLVHTAANLARAFHNLHQNAHVMGDINHGNCVVLADGTVKLIDCDSYSIKTEKMRYPCEVGVATHLAPELQGVNLRAAKRTEKHDNFGLAVIIFQLLFLGRHPFAGNYPGSEDKPLEDCIREHLFAYGKNAAIKNVRQPSGTLALAAVSPRVAVLFERAFLTEERPAPHEWVEALEDLAHNLEQCRLHPGHLYFAELVACPWCEIESQTGLMLFPFVTSGSRQNGEKPFDVFTVENLIASLGISNNPPARLPKPAEILPPPTPAITQARRDSRNRRAIAITAHFLALVFLMSVFGVGATVFVGIWLMAIIMLLLNTFDRHLCRELSERLTDARQKWQENEQEWTRTSVPQMLNDDLTRIRQKVHDYQEIQRQSVSQMKIFQADVSHRLLYKYLRSRLIAEAEISGVNARQRKILVENNIKTAAEIEENRLRYACGFDDESVLSLLEWRKRLENDFAKDAESAEILKAEQTRFAGEVAGERHGIEREIERLLTLLRAGSVHLNKRRRQIFSQSEELARQLSQTASDAETFGNNKPAMLALLLITFFTPFFGSFIGSINSPKTGAPAYRENGTFAPPKPVANPKADLDALDENITGAQIDVMPAADRSRYAEILYSQALGFNYGGKTEFAKAEQKSRLAVRLKNTETRFLNELGYALYQQRKYTESLDYLNRSLTLEKENEETKIFIAIDYLMMKKFAAARAILTEVTDKNPSSFGGFYNLGFAYAGLKDFPKAVSAFRQAVGINPNDADAHYELSYCFYKAGKKEEARSEYLILLGLDKPMAERLRKETKIY